MDLGSSAIKELQDGPDGGMEGSAKRIDTLATDLHAGLTVEEMINLDLGYAPPLSPVLDPVVTAARVVAKKL